MHLEKISLLKSIEERKAAEKQFMMNVEAEKVAIERERLNMQKTKEQLEFETNRKKEEERIMLLDLENLNPVQRKYFLARQAKILGRYGGGSGLV